MLSLKCRWWQVESVAPCGLRQPGAALLRRSSRLRLRSHRCVRSGVDIANRRWRHVISNFRVFEKVTCVVIRPSVIRTRLLYIFPAGTGGRRLQPRAAPLRRGGAGMKRFLCALPCVRDHAEEAKEPPPKSAELPEAPSEPVRESRWLPANMHDNLRILLIASIRQSQATTGGGVPPG